MSIEKLGVTTAKSLLNNTGKNWDQWVELLDRAGAKNWTHQEIVAHLKRKHKLKVWWQQVIANGFSVAIGRRQEGQNLKGEFAVTITKTLNFSARKVWQFLNSAEGIALWLSPMGDFRLRKGCQYEIAGGIFGEVRTIKAGERARLTWNDEEWPKKSVVQVMVLQRPNRKSLMVVMHEQLRDIRAREHLRAYWKTRLSAVAEALDTANR